MIKTRTAASSVALVSGALVAYAGIASGLSQDGQWPIVGLGVLLLVNSLVCFLGWRLAFAVSGAVSVLILVAASITWGAAPSELQLSALAANVVNVALALLALRSSTRIPEQANPMNLPVFG